MPAYSFTLPTAGGQDFVSDEHLPLIVYFYPKDNTPGCTTEGGDFRDLHADFLAAGCQVFGLSRDSIKSHENFKAKQSYPFELISDQEELACRALDVIKTKKLYGKEVQGVERSTFVINRDGKIEREWRGVKVPGHVAEVLAFVQALK